MHRSLLALLFALILTPGVAAQDTPTSEGDTFTCVLYEVQPELIGGLDGLQARVVYPDIMWRSPIEGQVIVRLVVTEQGEVEDPVVLRSPHEALNEAALDAVRASRFVPGTQRGKPVRVQFVVPVTFRHRGTAPVSEDG